MIHKCVIAALTLALLGCAGPRSDVVDREVALTMRKPVKVKIVSVHDGLQHSRDPHVSHLVEVELMDGPKKGSMVTWPYDEWSVSEPPPEEGTVKVVAPADFLYPKGKRQP